MAEITASMVKELRERTGAGMMDCKKALGETSGDIEAAIDWLRKKGLAAAAKKSGRVAAEGLVAAYTSGTEGALVEINAETDFVGRNDKFQAYVAEAAKHALAQKGDSEALKSADYPGTGRNFTDELQNLIAVIGENMNFRRSAYASVSQGVVTSYIHGAVVPGQGRIGVLVALESAADATKLHELGRSIAMHIAAANPQSLSIEEVDSSALDRERQVLLDQARASGKPEEVVQKMVEGRVRKFYEEIVLLEQVFVIDGESRVKQVVEKAAKDLGSPIKLTKFVRFALGEGIEKTESDFAAEVAQMAG